MPVIIDTSNLNGFCREIARMPAVGRSAWDVMLYEVRKILENCVRLTTRNNVNKITRSVEFKNRTLPSSKGYQQGVPTIYITKKGLIWFADYPGAGNEGRAGYKKKGLKNQRGMVEGKTFHPMNDHFRYGQPRWHRYQQFLADLRNKQIDVRAVIGRAGQTWCQMGAAVGITLEGVPAYIQNAAPFKGRSKVHGFGFKRQTASSMVLEMVNQNQIFFGTIDGNAILQKSINGRYKHFLDAFRRGSFNDVKEIASGWPGLIAA